MRRVGYGKLRCLKLSVVVGLCVLLLGSGCREEASNSQSPTETSVDEPPSGERVSGSDTSADAGPRTLPDTGESRDVSSETETGASGVRAGDDEFGFVRRRSIGELPGVESPDTDGPPSTMLLARRSKDSEREVAPGVTRQTRCGNNYCVDGLFAGETPLLEPVPGRAP